MKLFRIKIFAGIFAIFLLLVFGYYYREGVGRFWRMTLNQLWPCQIPITYSIANLDTRFGLTRTELLDYLKRAETIWESPIHKQLLEYSPNGDLKINLIYDYRQQATDTLRKMGIVISDSRSTYDALKAKYDLLVASYTAEKERLMALIATYNADKSAFEKDLNYYNHGKASKAGSSILEQEKADLNDQAAIIEQAQNSLNELVDTIRSAELVLNKLVLTLNLQVDKYNTVGASAGEQFREGEYTSGISGTAINIFQFDDTSRLMEVLAHEFGHALGLGHIDNPKAVMYYLNEGMNGKLTADDLAALKKVCGIK